MKYNKQNTFEHSLIFYLIFSVSVAICESVHRKKWMHVGHAVEMDQHVRNQCINGIWLQCPCVQPLAVEVSQHFNTHIFERLKMDFNQTNKNILIILLKQRKIANIAMEKLRMCSVNTVHDASRYDRWVL